MKIKKYAMILVCVGAIVSSMMSFQNSSSYVSADVDDVSLTMNDFFSVALASEDPPAESCPGSTCDEANGNKYNRCHGCGNTTCCGTSSTSSGKKR